MQLIKLTDISNDKEVWINNEFFYYMETGIRAKDNLPYTVIHMRAQTKAKVFVKETPEQVYKMHPGSLFAIRLTNNANGDIIWLNPVVIISIEVKAKDGKEFSIVNTSSTTQPKFFVSETPAQINEQIAAVRKGKAS